MLTFLPTDFQEFLKVENERLKEFLCGVMEESRLAEDNVIAIGIHGLYTDHFILFTTFKRPGCGVLQGPTVAALYRP